VYIKIFLSVLYDTNLDKSISYDWMVFEDDFDVVKVKVRLALAVDVLGLKRDGPEIPNLKKSFIFCFIS
jgi:hypothetical protein